MNKLTITTLLIIIISFSLCLQRTEAEPVDSQFQVVVYDTGEEGLALKEIPDINSNWVLLIPEETILLIDQVSGGWGHTSYFGKSGWINLRYTRIFGEYHTQQPSYGFITPYYYMVSGTEGEGLEFRCQPTIDCSTYCTLNDGTLLYVQAIQGDWAYAYCNGYFGWANMTFLNECSDKYYFQVSVYNTEGKGLALKANADINAESVLIIPEEQVLVISSVTSDGWGYTYYKGCNGWVRLRFTKLYSGYPVESPTYGFLEPAYYTVYNTDGEGLELRCKPTSDCSSFGTISDGIEVMVMAIQEPWAFVYYNWHYGWCNLTYMNKTDEQEARQNNRISDQYDLTAFTAQVKDVLFRFNFMDSNNGCASLSLEKISLDLAEQIPSSRQDYQPTYLPKYRIMDCNTIDEVLEQRHNYFSDEILWPDDDFKNCLTEYNGNVYLTYFAVDSNHFYLEDVYVMFIDDTTVIATCTREEGGSDYLYRLTFNYKDSHLMLVSMEKIF